MFNHLKLAFSELLKNKSIFLECGYHMHIHDSDRFVFYKGRVIRDKKYKYWNEETAIDKLYFRCLHIEALGAIPCKRNVSSNWEEYENLMPGVEPFKAYPLVIDDYYEGKDRWRPITEESYDWCLNAVPPVTMRRGAFLAGEAYTQNDEWEEVCLACRVYNHRYYAKLMILKEFKNKIHERIND